MDTVNLILLIVGAIVLLFGLGAFFNPNFARLINAPGGPRLKALISSVAGIILVIISLIIEFPTK